LLYKKKHRRCDRLNPYTYDEVTQKTDLKASYSSFGRHTVSVAAPGDLILSTLNTGSYGVMSGTSMAAPHVTGLIGLIKSYLPALTPAATRNLVLSSGDINLAMNGNSLTSKRINTASALACSNKPTFSLVSMPAMLSAGVPAKFTILSVNCDKAVGPITVTSATQNKSFTVVNTDGLATFTYTPTSSVDTLKFSSAAGSDMITLANPQITTATIPTLTQGGAVKIQLAGSGGTMPYSFSGSMPAGLTMSSTGLISGAPTASGVFSYILTIKDAKSIANSMAIRFTINPPPKVTTTALAQGKEGTAYSQTITVSGGVAPYTFSSTSSVAGLALSTSGTLAGTPTKVGVAQYVINVKDANGVLGTVTLPLTITAKAATAKPAVLSFITGLQTGQLTVSIQPSPQRSQPVRQATALRKPLQFQPLAAPVGAPQPPPVTSSRLARPAELKHCTPG